MSNFKLKSIWKDEDKAKINDIKNQIAQLQTTINALQTQLTTLNNEAVKLSGNQSIDGIKTFNSSLQLANNTYLAKGGERLPLATLVAQGQKAIDILFVQPTTGYRNYCHINLKVKNGNDANAMTVFTLQTRDTNAGVYATCEGNKFLFLNPTLVGGIQTPIGNNDAANKSYVDAIKTKIKEMASTSNDFASFKSKVGAW